MLGVGVLVNYFDRVNLSVAHDALQHQFGLSDVGFGALLSAYNWTYAALQLPTGSLLDRFGVRRVMIVAVLLWALASGMAAVATSVAVLFAARFVLGIGEAPTFPAFAKAVGLWFPADQRGVATASFDSAAKLSIGVGTPILGLVLIHYGLRANFATTAVLSLLYAGLFAWIYREPARSAPTATALEFGVSPHSLLYLLQRRKIIGTAIGAAAYNYTFYLLLTWLPVYLHRGLKMDNRTAVLWTAVPWLCAAASGLGIGGLLVDRLVKHGHDASVVRRAVLMTGTTFGLLVVAPAYLSGARVVLICLTLGISGLAAASPVMWSLPALLAPRAAGRAGGIMNFFSQLAAIAAPLATGFISQITHSLAGAFLLAAVILAIGIVSYAVLLGRIEPIPVPAEALV